MNKLFAFAATAVLGAALLISRCKLLCKCALPK